MAILKSNIFADFGGIEDFKQELQDNNLTVVEIVKSDREEWIDGEVSHTIVLSNGDSVFIEDDELEDYEDELLDM